MDNPWLNLIGVFQKYALVNYADQLVVSYDQLENEVRRTVFDTYTVYSNWSTTSSYTLDGNMLPPGGVVTRANDGSVTAGVFTSYNGQPLSDGDHYLVEVRSTTDIKMFQPVGADTTVHVKILSGAKATVTAYRYDGTAISAVASTSTNGDLSFVVLAVIDGQSVGYYQITGF
jgi:hypothetical protein